MSVLFSRPYKRNVSAEIHPHLTRRAARCRTWLGSRRATGTALSPGCCCCCCSSLLGGSEACRRHHVGPAPPTATFLSLCSENTFKTAHVSVPLHSLLQVMESRLTQVNTTLRFWCSAQVFPFYGTKYSRLYFTPV